MATATPFILLVGRNRERSPMADVRTPAQRAAVQAIAEGDRFAFACNNPFDPELEAARPCAFNFIWYDRRDVFHVTRIGVDGTVVRELTAD